MKKFLGFSLVELMISLIVISVVTAAFAPIVTKKLKTSDMSIGSGASEYIYDESICNSSVENCSVCIKDECIKCKAGYFLNTTNGACESCLDNCASCNNSSKCEKCNSGYLIKDSNTKCEKIECKEGCINCDLTSGCTKCSDGYYLNTTTKNCDKCKTGCLKCSDSSTCTTCLGGYRLSGTNCEKCPAGCKNCSSSTNCIDCVDNCEICIASTGCVKCAQGYFFNGTNCLRCTTESSLATLPNGKVIYKYNMGDECGPPIPKNVNICYAGHTCDYSVSSPICYKATKEKYTSSEACTHKVGASYYSGCTRTVCNRFAANIALKQGLGGAGWRLIKVDEFSQIATANADTLFYLCALGHGCYHSYNNCFNADSDFDRSACAPSYFQLYETHARANGDQWPLRIDPAGYQSDYWRDSIRFIK